MRKFGSPTVESPTDTKGYHGHNHQQYGSRNLQSRNRESYQNMGPGSGLTYEFPFQQIVENSRYRISYDPQQGNRQAAFQEEEIYDEKQYASGQNSDFGSSQQGYYTGRQGDDYPSQVLTGYPQNRQLYNQNSSMQIQPKQKSGFTDGIVQKFSSILPKSEEQKKVEETTSRINKTKQLEQRSLAIIKSIEDEISKLRRERDNLVISCRNLNAQLKKRKNPSLSQMLSDNIKRISRIDNSIQKKTVQKSVMESSTESLKDTHREETFKNTLSEISELKQEYREKQKLDLKDVADDYVADVGENADDAQYYSEMDNVKEPEWKSTNTSKQDFSYIMDEINDTEEADQQSHKEDDYQNDDDFGILPKIPRHSTSYNHNNIPVRESGSRNILNQQIRRTKERTGE